MVLDTFRLPVLFCTLKELQKTVAPVSVPFLRSSDIPVNERFVSYVPVKHPIWLFPKFMLCVPVIPTSALYPNDRMQALDDRKSSSIVCECWRLVIWWVLLEMSLKIAKKTPESMTEATSTSMRVKPAVLEKADRKMWEDEEEDGFIERCKICEVKIGYFILCLVYSEREKILVLSQKAFTLKIQKFSFAIVKIKPKIDRFYCA